MNGFIFDSEDFQRELQNSPHDAGEVEFLRSILSTGMYVIEAGAHRGVTAVAIARQIGREGHLYAFEPVPEFYAQLKENLLRNGVQNASAHLLALGERRERIRFYKHGAGSGITPAEGAELLHVEVTTVTDFLAEQGQDRIDLLNLDCEGSELLVLRGAKRLLEEHSPLIFCELHHGYLDQLNQSAGDVVDFLTELGYSVHPLQVEDLNAETNFQECSHLYAQKPSRESEIDDLKKKIADLKERMPIHSVKPSMMQELEDLEEQLSILEQESRQDADH